MVSGFPKSIVVVANIQWNKFVAVFFVSEHMPNSFCDSWQARIRQARASLQKVGSK